MLIEIPRLIPERTKRTKNYCQGKVGNEGKEESKGLIVFLKPCETPWLFKILISIPLFKNKN